VTEEVSLEFRKGSGYESFRIGKIRRAIRRETGDTPREGLDYKTYKDLEAKRKWGASWFEDKGVGKVKFKP